MLAVSYFGGLMKLAGRDRPCEKIYLSPSPAAKRLRHCDAVQVAANWREHVVVDRTQVFPPFAAQTTPASQASSSLSKSLLQSLDGIRGPGPFLLR